LILRTAFRALALDETVGQEHLLDRVVILLDRTHINQADGFQFGVDFFGVLARLGGMRGVVVVKGDMETGEVAAMFGMHAGDQLLRRDAFLFRAQHDGRAVRVVGADIPAFAAEHFLQAHPDIGLHVADQMAEMDRAIGVGQGAW